MTSFEGIPLPAPDPVSEPFWQALADGTFRLQRCRACGRFQHYPRPACVRCLSADLEWAEASGEGVVHSYTVIHRVGVPAWRARVPYVVALVDLAEGVRLQTNLVDVAPDAVEVGLPVRLRPERVDDRITLPYFAPR